MDSARYLIYQDRLYKAMPVHNTVRKAALWGRSHLTPANFKDAAIITDQFRHTEVPPPAEDPPAPGLHWNINDNNFLKSTLDYNNKIYRPYSIAWHPISGELVFGPVWLNHDYIINELGGSYPYDEWVRAFQSTRGDNRVVVRFWHPDEIYDKIGQDAKTFALEGPLAFEQLLKRRDPGLTVEIEEPFV